MSYRKFFKKNIKSSTNQLLLAKLPTLSFHIWGGVGSQLFAIAAINNYLYMHPNRKVRLCYHSGGVTRRTPDSARLLPNNVEYTFSDDFYDSKIIKNKGNNKNKHKLKLLIASKVQLFLRKTKIIVSWNDPHDVPVFWTLQVRGHYRTLPINEKAVNDIWDLAIKSHLISNSPNSSSNVALHYRLGDLIGLKPIVEPITLVNLIDNLTTKYGITGITLLSDSPKKAEQTLRKTQMKLEVVKADTWETVDIGVNSKLFIGTNSKLSYWICLFRLAAKNECVTFLPASVRSDFDVFLSNWKIDPKHLVYYESHELDV